MRLYNREHYQRNKPSYKEKAIKHNKRYRLRNAKFLYDYKKTHACVDCGESNPLVLSFDHSKEHIKIGDLSNLAHRAFSIQAIQNEIDKCDVRCANCHLIKTAKERKWRMLDWIEQDSILMDKKI